MKTRSLLLSLLTGLVLTACGGGGGGTGGGSTSGTTPPPVAVNAPISSSNFTSVASNAYAAHASIYNSQASVTGALTGVSIDGLRIGAVTPVLDLIKRKYSPGAPKLLTGVSLTDSCSGGGTISFNGTVKTEETVSNGDNVTITATNCVEDGAKMNGAFTMTFSGVSGTVFGIDAWAATIDIQFKAFSISAGSETMAVNGDMKLAMNQVSLASTSVAISGTSIQTSESKGGVVVSTRNLADYSVHGTFEGSGFSRLDASFTLSGNTAALGQFKYSAKTSQPFLSLRGAAPVSGTLVVTDADGASVYITAVDAGHVRLDYVAKPNGVITQSTTIAWADFTSNS